MEKVYKPQAVGIIFSELTWMRVENQIAMLQCRGVVL